MAAEDGKLAIDLAEYPYPDWAKNSVHLPHDLHAADFRLLVPTGIAEPPENANSQCDWCD